MARTFCYTAMLVLALFVLVGCGEKEPETPPPPPPPPPPTAQEILRDFNTALAPLQNRPVTDAHRQAALDNLTPLLASNRNSVNGPEAISMLRTQTVQNIRQAAADDLQGVVYANILVYELIEPGEDRYSRQKQRALDVLNRPFVKCNGFIETDGVLHVNLQVYDKNLKKNFNYFVAEGDLFHDDKLQLIKVIGNQSEVQLKYLKTDDTWVVPGPGNR